MIFYKYFAFKYNNNCNYNNYYQLNIYKITCQI